MIINVRQSDLFSDIDSSISYISEDIFKKLKLSESIPYQIKTGLRSQETYIKPLKKEIDRLSISSNLMMKLLLIDGIQTNIWLKDQILLIGPIVGTFVSPSVIKRIQHMNIPKTVELFGKANEEVKTILYFFSINEIDWESQKISGYIYIPKENTWKNFDLPFPNIINDQCSGYKKSEKEFIVNARKQFKEVYGIPFINNQNTLGKYDLYQQLSLLPDMKNYLPETVEYYSFQQLMRFLSGYSFIFLKAFVGSRGETIMSIQKNNNDHYVAFYYVKGKMRKRIIRKKYILKQTIEKFIKGRQYVIQQGISLIKYEGHKIDVRALLQKNRSGFWIVAGMFANIAYRDSTITNYHEAKGVIYKELYPKLKENMQSVPSYEQIAEMAIFFAKHVEKAFGEFGELGLDIAIDQNGSIWFIEANTMPDRYVGYIKEPEEESLNRFRPLLEYSKFLMGCDDYE